MTYFTFNGEHENDENFRVNVSFQAETLDDVLENFKLFLRGVGYSVDNLIVLPELKSLDLGEVNLSGFNTKQSTTSYAWDPVTQLQTNFAPLTTESIRPLTTADIQSLSQYNYQAKY